MMTILYFLSLRDKLRNILDNRFLPRWIVMVTDMVIVGMAFVAIYFLLFHIIDKPVNVPYMMVQTLITIPVFLLFAFIFRSHHGIIRHSGMHDAVTIFKVHALVTGVLFLTSIIGRQFLALVFIIPYSVIFLHFFVSVFGLLFMRFMVQLVYKKIWVLLQ